MEFINAMPKHIIPRNILVKDGAIVGIIDWKTAGFYPKYWGHTKDHFFVLARCGRDTGAIQYTYTLSSPQLRVEQLSSGPRPATEIVNV